MAQAIVLICDECGKPDASTITIRADGRNFAKDLCSDHLQALLKDTRAPRRGRPKRGASTAPTVPEPRRRAKRAPTKPAARKRASSKQASGKASTKKARRAAARSA